MELGELIKPLGIATYTFVIMTFLAGLFRAKLKLKLKYHKTLAWITVSLASLHGLLVFWLY
jgi:Mg2+ and Co2+ transporter CorA